MSISLFSRAQDGQTVFSIDSRVGYSSNAYLNPFFGEWNPDLQSAYGMLSFFGQSSFFDENNTVDLTGGVILEPLFSGQNFWKGALGVVDYRRKLSTQFNTGLEAGGSYFSGSFERSSYWIQPKITWFPSFFTSVTAKAGSHFRSYTNFADTVDSKSRFDLYGLEFETWAGYNWQIQANLYGSLSTLPEIQKQMSSNVSVGYAFLNGSLVKLNFGFEQYRFEVKEEMTGGPPIGGGGTFRTVEEADRIFRVGLNASVPVGRTVSVFASADALRREITATGATSRDVQISGGVRISFQPLNRSRQDRVAPEWSATEEGQMEIEVRYTGEGRLYLVGDFNDWSQAGISMIEREKNRYVARLDLDAGAYEYKLLLIKGDTEEWLEFSDNVHTVDDGFGGKNGLIFVEYN